MSNACFDGLDESLPTNRHKCLSCNGFRQSLTTVVTHFHNLLQQNVLERFRHAKDLSKNYSVFSGLARGRIVQFHWGQMAWRVSWMALNSALLTR